MSDKTTKEELAVTRDALHRACYALLSLKWAVEHSSQPPVPVGCSKHFMTPSKCGQ